MSSKADDFLAGSGHGKVVLRAVLDLTEARAGRFPGTAMLERLQRLGYAKNPLQALVSAGIIAKEPGSAVRGGKRRYYLLAVSRKEIEHTLATSPAPEWPQPAAHRGTGLTQQDIRQIRKSLATIPSGPDPQGFLRCTYYNERQLAVAAGGGHSKEEEQASLEEAVVRTRKHYPDLAIAIGTYFQLLPEKGTEPRN